MRVKIMCLAMLALMVIGTPFNVYAEDFQGAKAWKVSFDGKKMNSNFKSAELSDDILTNVQPGDSITLQIELKNDSDRRTDWYMANEVLRTLEDGNTAASGGAYTYILTYNAPDGTQSVLYSSDEVGGESKAGTSEGLYEATDALDEFFYLDRLDDREQASVNLYVKLDGETQGNAYQKTLAKLKMNFAVEKVNDLTVERHTAEKKEVVTYTSSMVKTGDHSNIVIFSAVTLVSGLALLVIALIIMEKQREEKGE